MVAPVKLAQSSIPLLLQICTILWDHYTILIQEQAREMLVHLIHELVISRIEDDMTNPNKDTIEDLIESIRQHKANVVWTYQECNGKEEEDDGNRVPSSMTYLTNEVINLFELAYPNIHEQWVKTTLSWATSCSVRHLACRSFQIFRCILSSLDQPMLADMLARLSNTIADEAAEVQTFSMEILKTLKTIVDALEPADLLKYPQLFWATCACLNTINECEFIETLGMLEKLLLKVNLNDAVFIRLLSDAKPERWEGQFDGITPLVHRGLKSEKSLIKSLTILEKTVSLPDSKLIGEDSRLLFCTLAYLPCFLKYFDTAEKDSGKIDVARRLAVVAETEGYQEISMVLNAFANSRYTSREEFLNQTMSTIRQSFFPKCELRSLIFLMGLLANRLSWYKINVMRILCVVIPEVDMCRTEIARHGSDLITPLLRLLQTEYCPQALEVMDHILDVPTSAMDKHHMRMSMLSSSSRSTRKEYERTQSLYGIPEDTGWSIPMPAVHSSATRANVHAVFYTCANSTEATATPEIEFDSEEFGQGSYFPSDRTNTMMTEDPRIDPNTDIIGGDLLSKFDSLDDFFEDTLSTESKYLSHYSDITITGFSPDTDEKAELYDQRSTPILNNPLARTLSVSSLHNTATNPNLHPPLIATRDPAIMTPGAFTSTPLTTGTFTSTSTHEPTPGPSSAPQLRPSLHSRSITSPANAYQRNNGDVELLSDDEVDEIFSDDERSTGNNGPPIFETMIRRTKSTVRKLASGSVAKDARQKDTLRARSKHHTPNPNSPEVPKVPEAYLMKAFSDL